MIFRYLLLITLASLACVNMFVSDTKLPQNIKIVSDNYPIYDGKRIQITGKFLSKFPSSISGSKQYTWKELTGLKATVIGEYELTQGNYFIINTDEQILIKIPSSIFFDVIIFINPPNYDEIQ